MKTDKMVQSASKCKLLNIIQQLNNIISCINIQHNFTLNKASVLYLGQEARSPLVFVVMLAAAS